MFFFFSAAAPSETYSLSLHDALPICPAGRGTTVRVDPVRAIASEGTVSVVDLKSGQVLREIQTGMHTARSEEHTSELQSPMYLVCRLLLEKKNNIVAHTPRVCSIHPR